MNLKTKILVYEEGMDLQQFVGQPMVKDKVNIGKVISTEVKDGYVEATVELSIEGEKFFAKGL